MAGAPNNHPRQCQAKSQRTRKQCRRWALKTSNYCQFHGGRLSNRAKWPMGYYGKHLGKTLKKRIEEILNTSHHEQISLYEELAIARLLAIQALKLAEPALLGEVKDETKHLAHAVLRDAMNHVKDLCLAASRIEKDAEDKVSITVLDLFIKQILRAIKRCNIDNKLYTKIESEIEKTVRLPLQAGNAEAVIQGTTSTPDMVTGEMDATIGVDKV